MKTRIFIILISFISLSCTSDDALEEPEFQDVRGKVVGTAACNTENNGTAFEIELMDGSPVSKIITPNLPDNFKEEGQEIIFDMEQSQKGFSFCAAIYYPEMFYRVYDVKMAE